MFTRNIVSGAFRSLHCLIYKVLARPPQRRNVLYLTTSVSFCQALFSTFSKFFRRLPRLSAALSDSSSIISELPEFVKCFFHFVENFFALSLARPPRFRQLAYYTRPSLLCQHFFPRFLFSSNYLSPGACATLFFLFPHLPYARDRAQNASFFAPFMVHIGYLSYILLLLLRVSYL